MMHSRTLHSLLIVSFIVVFAASMSFASGVTVNGTSGLLRCDDFSIAVTADLDVAASAIEVVLVVDEVSGGGYLENLSVTIDPAFSAWDTGSDLTQANGTAPDTIRFWAIKNVGGDDLAANTGIALASIGFTTSKTCDGVAGVEGGEFDFAHPTGTIETQMVVASTGLLEALAVTGGTVGIANAAPAIDAIPDPGPMLYGSSWSHTMTTTDADANNTCETATYELVSGPAGLTLTVDLLEWDTDATSICDLTPLVVKVTDWCGIESQTDELVFCIFNNPPAFTDVPAMENLLSQGEMFEFDLNATDPDGGPYEFFYLVDGPVGMTVDVNSGAISYEAAAGSYAVTVMVTDAAATCDPCSPSNSAEYTFNITVQTVKLIIEVVPQQIQGQYVDVSIDLGADGAHMWPIAGFDLLIAYDASALSFQKADEGLFFTDCNWEYFTYRFGPYGNCDGGCPSGVLRIVGMAESQGGDVSVHPDCFVNDGVVTSNTELATMTFLVSNDRTLECQFAPIRFTWYDCADNSVSSVTGDSLFLTQQVHEYVGGVQMYERIDITYAGTAFPNVVGITDHDECIDPELGPDKYPVRVVKTYHGGIEIACADSIDAAGDINLNEIPYEIADAVMFTNYFVEGTSAFGDHVDGSIAASDTNKDGIPLSVSDLVYLIRVIVGDALPYAKGTPENTNFSFDNNVMNIESEMGAAFVVFEGNVRPNLLADNMDMVYGFDGRNTRALVYSMGSETFSGNFIQADADMISAEFATYEGRPVAAKLVPLTFRVEQNYPNPFNPSTAIEFQIPGGGAWKLDIYNVAGQLVESFEGVSEGFETVTWEAGDRSSGVYFYRVTAGDYSSTKKAVLLK